MSFGKRAYRRWVGWIAVAVAVVVVAAPSALAAGEFPTLQELGQFSFTPSGEPAAPTIPHSFSFTPSSEPVAPTVVASDPANPFPPLAELERFSFTPESQAPPIATPVAAPGIDWRDAGIGIGIGIAAAFLVVGIAALGSHRRRLAHS